MCQIWHIGQVKVKGCSAHSVDKNYENFVPNQNNVDKIIGKNQQNFEFKVTSVTGDSEISIEPAFHEKNF